MTPSPNSGSPTPDIRRKNRWSLFGAKDKDHETRGSAPVSRNNRASSSNGRLADTLEVPAAPVPMSGETKLRLMGFTDEALNRKALKESRYDTDKAVEWLIKNNDVNPNGPTVFQVLGVSQSATKKEIDDAFRKKTLELVKAYQILSDDLKRQAYEWNETEFMKRFNPDLSDRSLFDCIFEHSTSNTNVIEEASITAQVMKPLATTSNPHTFIPAYFYPGQAWTQSIEQPSNVEYMIVNPNSGPGDAINPHYVETVKEAQQAGVKIIGYVHTEYGKRFVSTVKQEISRYLTWYKVDGIFLDEVSSSKFDLSYYKSLAIHIRSLTPSSSIVLNPGVYPDEGYMEACDLIVTYEDAFNKYHAVDVPNWSFQYPAHQFIHIVHSTPKPYFSLAVQQASERNVGHVFFTDALMPNPYDKLPTYFDKHKAL
ncbi:UNVERIFIED_CONTAM: hypothetical protein HDU68_002702 [Siphonaria sp. JEL0065]|nr:hypothetical protein HDU68_002702 [Siphonaria sp. JEL0065]